MKPEAQRVAIAEACGWIRSWDKKGKQWIQRGPDFTSCDPDPNADWELRRLPDYLNDLNAMHQAECGLGPDNKKIYADRLFDVSIEGREGLHELDGWYLHIHATAAQRAEAFLKTIGKWHP